VRIGPVGVAVTPDGTHAYVANAFSKNVSVIDTASNTVVATVAVGTGPDGVAITPDGKTRLCRE
jgi:YVTN family beta-propeller protein